MQFMHSAHTQEDAAAKPFLSRSVFNAELELYQMDVRRSRTPAVRVGQQLPAIEHIATYSLPLYPAQPRP